ncbi:hypothetical protein MOTC310_01690 [Methylobacterium oryzae]|uniref:Uncharacterized protein n=1 Tax=Methylobacterium oryzae TaxID=334852 RepID=A0ABU7THQ6_9HYPH
MRGAPSPERPDPSPCPSPARERGPASRLSLPHLVEGPPRCGERCVLSKRPAGSGGCAPKPRPAPRRRRR